MNAHEFPEAEKKGVYRAIFERRDMRSFKPDPIPDLALARLLDAAHHAGSVGFMQPWNFVVIKNHATRARVHELFQKERQAAALFFDEPRRHQYLSMKLEGILESPLNLCVTCDQTRGGVVLGRNSIPETDVYSTVGAIQNLWLAARAEGIGVGWVSILRNPELRSILDMPPHIIPVAYLCLGYVEDFPERPVLETRGWRHRLPLTDLVYYERWGCEQHPDWAALSQSIIAIQGENMSSHLSETENASRVLDVIRSIPPLDDKAMQAARARHDQLTKPQGSLGRLEALSIQLAGIAAQPRPHFKQPVIVTMAADHGGVRQGVSAFPQEVTPQMVANFLHGGAAINVLARHVGARVVVVDMGVAADLDAHPDLVDRKIAKGTRDFSVGPAMAREEARRAVEAGIEIVTREIERGADIIGTGDMGIGNTTASSAIVAAITRRPVAQVTGRGTGVDDVGLARKIATIERALEINRPNPNDAFDVLADVGGFEIGGLAGVMLGAAARRVPVVIDGFISGAAALVAYGLAPAVQQYLVAAHRSVEIGHRATHEYLRLEPLLDLNMRLGEGTGAALGISLCVAACKILDEMATFADAGVAEKSA